MALTARDLASRVQMMRNLQKGYFRGDKSLLETCRKAERYVDQLVDEVLAPPSLFDLVDGSTEAAPR